MYSTDGIILKKETRGEADALFTIYTKDFGKIKAVAQGIHKEGAKLKGHLEPLSLASIGFVLGRNGERLTHASLINFWPAIRADFEKTFAASRMAEMVDKYCLENERDERLWSLLIAAFEKLERGSAGPGFESEFDAGFLAVLGYEGEKDLVVLDR